jgi:hypothetical protein
VRSTLLLFLDALPDDLGEVVCPKALASQLFFETLSPEALLSSFGVGWRRE